MYLSCDFSGSFIQVKDIKWAHVAERVLGRKITSFCVDNQADGEVLRNLMSEVNFDHKGMPIVIVSKFRNKVRPECMSVCSFMK